MTGDMAAGQQGRALGAPPSGRAEQEPGVCSGDSFVLSGRNKLSNTAAHREISWFTGTDAQSLQSPGPCALHEEAATSCNQKGTVSPSTDTPLGNSGSRGELWGGLRTPPLCLSCPYCSSRFSVFVSGKDTVTTPGQRGSDGEARRVTGRRCSRLT